MLKKNGGFTIVQTLVSIGILGIISAGTASWLSGVSRQMAKTKVTDSFSQVARETRMKLGQKNTCKEALGLPLPLKTFEDIQKEHSSMAKKFREATTREKVKTPGLLAMKYGRGQIQGAGAIFTQENLKVHGLYPAEISDLKMSTIQDGHVYLARLKMKAEIAAGTTSGHLKDEDVGPLYLITDATDNVIECFAELDPADFLETSCLSMGGEYDAETKKCAIGSLALEKICLSFNGDFDKNTGTCGLPLDGRKICMNLGGSWSRSSCNFGSRDVASNPDSSDAAPASGSSWECRFVLRGEKGAEWTASRFNKQGDCTAEAATVKANNPKATIVKMDKIFTKDPFGESIEGDSAWACNFSLRGAKGNTWSVTRYVASQSDCAGERGTVEKNNPNATIIRADSTFTKTATDSKSKWICYYTLKGKKGNTWTSQRETTDSKSCDDQTAIVKVNNKDATITKVTGPSFVKL